MCLTTNTVSEICILDHGESVQASSTYPWAEMSCFSCWLWAKLVEVQKNFQKYLAKIQRLDNTFCRLGHGKTDTLNTLLVRVQNGVTSMKRVLAINNIHFCPLSNITLWGIFPEYTPPQEWNICLKLFIEALAIIAKYWKWPKFASVGTGWIIYGTSTQ